VTTDPRAFTTAGVQPAGPFGDRTGANGMILEARNLTKRYRLGNRDVDALRGVSLRVKRGEFVSAQGQPIHADIHGSYNILRKALPSAFAREIQGVVVRPVQVQQYENWSIGFLVTTQPIPLKTSICGVSSPISGEIVRYCATIYGKICIISIFSPRCRAFLHMAE